MSILNLKLQYIELIRTKINDKFEEIMKYYNSIAKKESQLKKQLLNNLYPTIELMKNLIKRLELKKTI